MLDRGFLAVKHSVCVYVCVCVRVCVYVCVRGSLAVKRIHFRGLMDQCWIPVNPGWIPVGLMNQCWIMDPWLSSAIIFGGS